MNTLDFFQNIKYIPDRKTSTKKASMYKIKYKLKFFWLNVSYFFRKTYATNICGHRTKKTGKVESLGKKYILSLPLSTNKNPDYCLDCIARMAIRCARCAEPILIGSPITLEIPLDPSKVPAYAVRYDKDPRCFIHCLGWDCAPPAPERHGFWMPPGKVLRVQSPMEKLLDAIQNGPGEPKLLIINDLSDPNDSGTFVY